MSEQIFLLITQRPLSFPVDEIHPSTRNILIKKIHIYGVFYNYVIILDLSDVDDEESRLKLLGQVKEFLLQLALDQAKLAI